MDVLVSYVRYLIGWIAKKFEYINRVNKRLRLRSTRLRRHILPSRSYAPPWIDLACAQNFFVFHATFPNRALPRLSQKLGCCDARIIKLQ